MSSKIKNVLQNKNKKTVKNLKIKNLIQSNKTVYNSKIKNLVQSELKNNYRITPPNHPANKN